MKQSYPRVRVKTSKAVAARPNIRASYEAAKDGRRAQGWARAQGVGPDTAANGNFPKLIKRSRFEARNHAVASRIVDVVTSETIGTGLRPHIVNDEKLEDLWSKWVQQCDADGIQDFYGLQGVAMRDIVIAGEVFERFRPRRLEDGLPVPLQIQLLPAEMVPYENRVKDAKSGIIFAGPGRRNAYLFHQAHPGEADTKGGKRELSVVLASTVSHIFFQREIGQIRGEPWLTRAIIKIHDLDAYTDAEMIRKKLTAMIAFFVEMPERDDPQTFEDIDENGDPVIVDAAGNIVDDPWDIMPEVEPGATLPLPAGAKMKQSTAADVGGSFDPFIKQIMREICAAVSVPYELVTGDYGSMNDRLVRINFIKFYAMVKQWRAMMINGFCRPAWREFLKAAEVTGKWSPEAGKTIADYMNVEWIGDPFPHIHPTQDVQADALAVRHGFKTKSQVIRERGGNPDIVRRDRALELAADDAAGLVNDTDPRKTATNGTSNEKEEAVNVQNDKEKPDS